MLEEVATIEKENITGCYVARLGKDIYTLEITSQEERLVNGTLRFKNFEKDSSSGTLQGTYNNDIILGTYAFQSEGMDSEIEVAFKKTGDNFIRGYGDMSTSTNKFMDIDAIKYDDSVVLMKEECTQAV